MLDIEQRYNKHVEENFKSIFIHYFAVDILYEKCHKTDVEDTAHSFKDPLHYANEKIWVNEIKKHFLKLQ